MKTFYYGLFLCLSLAAGACKPAFYYTGLNKVPGENEYEAVGYLSNDPIPMLLNDTIWLGLNTPKPDDAYLLIAGSSIDTFFENPNNNAYGASVKLSGNLSITKKGLKGIFGKRELKLNVQNIETNSGGSGAQGPEYVDHCAQYPSLCNFGSSSNNRYALLYSGGKIEADASKRYWNDLELMYLTLRSKCGFAADKIIVVYKEGDKENPSSLMRVNYPATRDGLEDAIDELNSRMNATTLDTLFVFTTNHGGGYATAPPNTATATNAGQDHGGVNDSASSNDNDEPEASNKTDETIFYYAENGIAKSLRDDSWKSKWSGLISNQVPFMVSLYEQCFSGGYLWDMKPTSPAKRVNIAAASEFGFSYGMPPDYVYDTFCYFFTLALYGKNLDGSPLSPNPDIAPADNKISIWEAFWYANQKDPGAGHEHFIDDTGDGAGAIPTGTTNPSSGNDGFLSKSIIWRW